MNTKKHQEAVNIDRFDCQVIPYDELRNRIERRYIKFVHIYTTETLNADPASEKLTIEDLKNALADIGKAFPFDGYWFYESYKNEIYVRRAAGREICATIIVKR